jgi:magnesium chelatase accessory protein
MPDGISWERDGRDWPNREASRFVRAAGLRWHVQRMGHGPVMLLIHGTGAATHSWRALAPLLARRFTVVAPDLPGHGFTDPLPGHRLTLPGMARALRDLLRALGAADPVVAVGHSAGAAILVRMSLDGMIAPLALVGLNAAMLPPPGGFGDVAQPIARLVARTPFLPQFFAWRAGSGAMVDGLLRGTGSTIDPAGAALYQRLARTPRQVAGALGMMAGWDLRPLARDLPRLKPRLTLVVGTNDGMVPPSEAERARALLPTTEVIAMPGLGHLAHEERPEAVAAIIERVACAAGALPVEAVA